MQDVMDLAATAAVTAAAAGKAAAQRGPTQVALLLTQQQRLPPRLWQLLLLRPPQPSLAAPAPMAALAGDDGSGRIAGVVTAGEAGKAAGTQVVGTAALQLLPASRHLLLQQQRQRLLEKLAGSWRRAAVHRSLYFLKTSIQAATDMVGLITEG